MRVSVCRCVFAASNQNARSKRSRREALPFGYFFGSRSLGART